jgi:hypothetical protein
MSGEAFEIQKSVTEGALKSAILSWNGDTDSSELAFMNSPRGRSAIRVAMP